MKVTVETSVQAPIDEVWRMFNDPADMMLWDASDGWRITSATNDLRVGGGLELRIEPKAGGSYEFRATYTEVEPMRTIAWRNDQGRHARIEFRNGIGAVHVRQTFEADPEPSMEEQRQDWQAVLDGFARHVTARTSCS